MTWGGISNGREGGLKGRIVGGAAWSAAGAWVSHGLSLAVFLVLARLLKPEDFGLMALAGIYIALLQVLVESGFGQALIQREKLERGHLDTAFWVGIALALAMMALSVVVAPSLAAIFEEVELAEIVVALSPVFLLSALSSTQQAVLSRDLRFKALALRGVLATVLGGGVGITMAATGFGVWSLVAQLLVASLVGAIALWSASAWRPGAAVSRRSFGELFPLSVNVLGIGLLSFVNQRFDQLLIGGVFGAGELGSYAVARRVFRTMNLLLVQVFSRIGLPALSRLQRDPAGFRDLFYRATRIVFLVSAPAFLGVILVAPELVTTVMGTQWSASVPVLRLMCGVGLLYGFSLFLSPALLAKGYAKTASALHFVNTIGNVVAFLVAVPWGIVAVAAAFLLRAIVLTPLSLWIMRNRLGVSTRRLAAEVSKPFGALLAMVATVQVCGSMVSETVPLYRLLVMAGVGAATYLGVLFVLDRRLVGDLRSAFSLLRQGE